MWPSRVTCRSSQKFNFGCGESLFILLPIGHASLPYVVYSKVNKQIQYFNFKRSSIKPKGIKYIFWITNENFNSYIQHNRLYNCLNWKLSILRPFIYRKICTDFCQLRWHFSCNPLFQYYCSWEKMLPVKLSWWAEVLFNCGTHCRDPCD
jgi:hypothetical protein